jgi:fructokinase
MLSIEGDIDRIVRQLADRYFLRLAALTRGPGGSLLFADGRTSDRSAHETQVADTVGAGDAFTAAMALGMLAGHDLDRINDQASRVASYVCSQKGATPPLPEELTALFA